MTAIVGSSRRVEDPVAAAWQQRRSELVHDWLHNRFLPRVQACLLTALHGAQISPMLLATFHDTIREWPARSAEVRALADDFCEVMSPRRIVENVTPALDGETAAFVRTTAFELWAQRRGIARALRELRQACSDTDHIHAQWTADPSDAYLRELAVHGERVAIALGRLPARAGL